jgi:hypothetical protein
VDWPAVVHYTDGGIVAEIENISANGAFIRCEKALRPKEKFKLHMVAPNHTPLIASAEVAWLHVFCSDDNIPPCAMGIRFTRASRNVRQFIRGFITEHVKKKN